MPIKIEIVDQADEELSRALQRLVPQLTTNNRPPSPEDLVDLVQSSTSTLMVARNEKGEIIGALTLAIYRVPTGLRSIIEDVIVDETARGRGTGEALMKFAIDLARKRGVGNIALTSNPRREAANSLYLRVGFQKRDTNAYQYKF